MLFRSHNEAVNALDFMTERREIVADYAPGELEEVRQHDGSILRLRKLAADYDVHDRIGAMTFLQRKSAAGEIATGLLYIDPQPTDLHAHLQTVATPLNALGEIAKCPGDLAVGLDRGDRSSVVATLAQARNQRDLCEQRYIKLISEFTTATGPEDLVALPVEIGRAHV